MRIIRKGEVPPMAVPADAEGNPAEGTSKQVLVDDGPNFVLRLFTIAPGGHTPRHTHPWEHEVYVVSGRGALVGDERREVAADDAVYVAPGELHSFENTGDEDMRMICVVPKDSG